MSAKVTCSMCGNTFKNLIRPCPGCEELKKTPPPKRNNVIEMDSYRSKKAAEEKKRKKG